MQVLRESGLTDTRLQTHLLQDVGQTRFHTEVKVMCGFWQVFIDLVRRR